MKKYIYLGYLLLLLLITGLSACKKNDSDKFDKTPGQRSTEALNKYQTQLTSAPNGWKAILYPSAGGIYLFSIKFGANDRTTMLSDIDSTKSVTPLESGYIIKQLQAPSLVFDTYSYIHLLSDPNPNVQGGQAGVGYSSDFEFSFDKTSGDTITLKGNRNGSKLVLVKAATPAEYTAFTTGTSVVFGQLSTLRTYFKRVTIGGTDCEINIDRGSKLLSISYLDAGTSLKTVSSSFYVDGSTNSIVLNAPLLVDKTSITTIGKIAGDAANHTVNLTINSSTTQIKEAITPLKYDLTAAKVFHNNPANSHTYWESSTGFTVDNVVDAFNLRSIFSEFVYRLYSFDQGTTYDRLGFFTDNGYSAGDPAVIAKFPASGTIVFTYFGSFNGAALPTSAKPIITATTNKFLDPNGFYVIQTGAKTYDLVNATDARAWISFY